MALSTRLLAGSALAVCLTAPAWAAAAQPPAGGEAANQIAEVVVTAQRRTENIQNVPLSVTALSPETLSDHRVSDPAELVRVAPSLQVESNNNSAGSAAFSIRGVGTLAFAPSIESSVGLVIDDVAMARPETAALNLYDIADVEVLNGPQGMLFGKNASAGLVKITTNSPRLNEFSSSIDGEYGVMSTPGHGNEYVAHGMLNAPLTGNSALRLSGSIREYDPLVRDVFTKAGQDGGLFEGGVRLKYLWDAGGRLRVLLAADYTHGRGIGSEQLTYRVHATPGLAASDAALGITAGPNNVFNSANAPNTEHYSVGGVRANISYEFDNGGTLTDILAWREYDQKRLLDDDMMSLNIVDRLYNPLLVYSQLSNELRYASATGKRLEYQFGLFYLQARESLSEIVAGNAGLGPPPPGLQSWIGLEAYQLQHINSIAPFGQATFHFSDKLAFTAGLRYTHDDVDSQSDSLPTAAAIQLATPAHFPKTSIQADNLSWRASLQYSFTPDLMAYATIARGYKGPGFNLFDPTPVRPEISHQREIGVKSAWFNRRLVLNFSIFEQTFDDFQAQTFIPEAPFFKLLNAGSLKTRGFEAQAQALVWEGLTLQAGVAYADSQFKSFTGDQCYAGEPAGTAPAQNVCFENHSNSSGNRLPNAPRWSATVSADYSHRLNEVVDWRAHGSLYTRTSVNFASNADPSRVQTGYSLLGASVGLQAHDGNWALSVFCKNCLDQRFVSYIVPFPLAPADYVQTFVPDSFRTIGVSVSKQF